MFISALGLLILGVLIQPSQPSTDVIGASESPPDSDANFVSKGLARDKKTEKFLYPLLVGMKLTTLVTATLTALKIFVAQALVVSKVALLGASFLALKALFEYLKQKMSHINVAKWEVYPYHGLLEWSAGQGGADYSPYYYSGPGDLHGLGSNHARVVVPRENSNHTPSARADALEENETQIPAVIGYTHVLTKITKTTHD